MSYFFTSNNNKNIEILETLVGLVSTSSIGGLKIKEGELEISIDGKVATQTVQPSVDSTTVETVSRVAQQTAPKSVLEQDTIKVETGAVKGNVVKAPIVGTFYASPSPNKPAYVKVGDTVKKGDVIMIIESMKLMNEVTSEYDGVVKEIMVKDGSPVEYDQPIMVIE